MNTLKIFLITVSVLLVGAVFAGVYVWYSVQKLNSETSMYRQDDVSETKKSMPESETTQKTSPGVTIEKVDEIPQDAEIIEIHTGDLSDSQKKALQVVGIDGDTFVVTEAMITCAKDAISPERFEAILGGAAPTPLESFKLLPCMK